MNRYIERGRHPRSGTGTIEWVRVRTPRPAGIVFLPPLIGGRFSQQLQTFRWLTRKGFDLISFNYSGHGDSGGRFSLGATLSDTHGMLSHALQIGRREGLPLSAVASCYSAIPLLKAVHLLDEPLERVVLINALPRLCPYAVLSSFFNYYLAEPGSPAGISRAVEHYLELLFPEIMKTKEQFGILERKRARLLETLFEFFTLNPLKGIALRKTPVLSLYSRMDKVIGIFSRDMARGYCSDILKLCPRAEFHPLGGDHYLSHPDLRMEARTRINAFFMEGVPNPESNLQS